MNNPLAKRLLFSLLALAGCSDSIPLPDEFDAAFTVGQVCAPQNVATGDPSMTYPVQFDLCVYRCMNIERTTAAVSTMYQCVGDQCQMVMLATAHATRDPDEVGCDARDMADPPADECTTESFLFDVTVPTINDEAKSGDFLVTIPYLELDEGQQVIDRIEAGEDPNLVIEEEVGEQEYPQRQFNLNFDPSHEPVADHASIPESGCHRIDAP